MAFPGMGPDNDQARRHLSYLEQCLANAEAIGYSVIAIIYSGKITGFLELQTAGHSFHALSSRHSFIGRRYRGLYSVVCAGHKLCHIEYLVGGNGVVAGETEFFFPDPPFSRTAPPNGIFL